MREPTTVTALNGMERAGFIKRVPSKEDRRKVHIFLTAKGRRLRDKLIPCVAEVNAVAARELDPADIAVLRRVLLKMSDNLAREEAAYLKNHAGVTLPMGSETP
jgi:DNA-binding MarR family transcriptional regulator